MLCDAPKKYHKFVKWNKQIRSKKCCIQAISPVAPDSPLSISKSFCNLSLSKVLHNIMLHLILHESVTKLYFNKPMAQSHGFVGGLFTTSEDIKKQKK